MEQVIEQNTQQLFMEGVVAHKEGNFKEAQSLYRSILQHNPLHPDVNHNLGLLEIYFKKVDMALSLFKTAIEQNPNIEQFWLSYIDALITAKQFETATQVIKRCEDHGFKEEKVNALKVKINQSKNLNYYGPSQKQIDCLIEHFQSSRFNEVEKTALLMTKEFPENQFGWKVLGAVFYQTGKILESIFPSQKSVKLAPQDAQAHFNLGNSLSSLGRNKEAKISFKKSIFLKPDYYQAYFNLGNTYFSLSKLEKAENSFKKAILSKPDYPEAYYNLGNTYKDMERFEEAKSNYEQATSLNKDYFEAYNNLGVVLQKLGRLKEAVLTYRQVIRICSNYPEAHYNLANTLNDLGCSEEAEFNLKKAISLKSDYPEAHFNLGNIKREENRFKDAEIMYKQAIIFKPDYPEVYNNLGSMLQELGRLDEAESSYTKAINFKSDFTEAYRNLSGIKNFDKYDDFFHKMETLYLDTSLSADQRCNICFGLAKAFEDLGELEKAFKHYSEGNSLRKKLLGYDIEFDIQLFNDLKNNSFEIEKVSFKSESFVNTIIPIFIIGMPRSGTTLVEQIVSSHPKITGADELPFVAQFGHSIARGMTSANKNELIQFREQYLAKLQHLSNGNQIITDKMPMNFRYVGLLAAAFPEAKIIHVKRNPAAVCWANYKQYFTSKSIGHCYALQDVIKYHMLYEDIMEFWTKSLAQRIYNLNYEMLTVNQEDETKKLVEYIGLNWDERCLLPENNKRSVGTASNIQVRQKVYQGSSQQWKKFKPFLNGILDNLDR